LLYHSSGGVELLVALSTGARDTIGLDGIALSLRKLRERGRRATAREQRLTLTTSTLDALALDAIAFGLAQLGDLERIANNIDNDKTARKHTSGAEEPRRRASRSARARSMRRASMASRSD